VRRYMPSGPPPRRARHTGVERLRPQPRRDRPPLHHEYGLEAARVNGGIKDNCGRHEAKLESHARQR
jgi:hypothetical protein